MKKNICLLLIAALMCSCAGQDNGKDDFISNCSKLILQI